MFLRQLLLQASSRVRVRRWRSLIRAGLSHSVPGMCIPGAETVVVLAPHMDDETLGCGGTIARHVEAGARVTVVFMTDGRHGGTPPDGNADLGTIRKHEAMAAANVLGVHELHFLCVEDTRLAADRAVALKLRAILLREMLDCQKAAIVYLPFFLDAHADHRATSEVMLAAVAGTSLEFECRGYEVTTPLTANCLVGIDSMLELKKRALACYRSQLAVLDYAHSALGLNAYRSLSAGDRDCRFAEAFHALPLDRYRALVRTSAPKAAERFSSAS